MLLIAAGFGHDAAVKVWLSFRATESFNAESFIEAALNYGCEGRFADKAASVLTSSGRYDCCLQRNWVDRRLPSLMEEMDTAGVRVFFDPEYSPPKGYRP